MASNNFADDIAKALQEFSSDVEKALEKAQKSATTKGVSKLKSTSPKKTGRYASGWRSKKDEGGRVIYNGTRGSITHLLEKGHALRGGGRVRGITHIAPVEQEVIEFYEKEFERIVGNG